MLEWYYIILIIIGSILLLLLLMFIILGGHFYRTSFIRRKGDKHFAENEKIEDKQTEYRIWEAKQEKQEYTMKSFDGKTLKGYMYKNNSNKLAFLIHGYRGRYYSLSQQAKMYYEAGYNVFAINHRAHDTSSGTFFSMGPKEEKDVIMWLELLIKENPDYQIVLLGISMGAHITMLTVGDNKLPNNVKCAIEDCGFATLNEELFQEMRKTVPSLALAKTIFWCGKHYAKIFHAQNIMSDTKESLNHCRVPLLLIHGELDRYVPYENLDINYERTLNVYKEKKAFSNAKHCECAKLNEEEYRKTIIDFSNRWMK